MEGRVWVYRTVVPAMKAPPGQRRLLRFKGLDYRVRIFINDAFWGEHEGMFSPVEIELDAEQIADDLTLHLVFLPPAALYPDPGAALDNVNAAVGRMDHLKARYMKGWDFCPELKCVGIWDAVEVEWRSASRVESVGFETRMVNRARAEVYVDVAIRRPEAAGVLRIELGTERAEVPVNGRAKVRVGLMVRDPELWYPHTHGTPALSDLTVTLVSADAEPMDTVTRRVGLREVSRKPALKQRPIDTPAQYVVNGEPIFLCGANLTPFSSVPSELGRADYLRVLEPLKATGVNFLRVWGGGLAEKDAFYDLCDEMGFLVMQEFPLACETISAEPAFLALLEREARAIVRRLRSHPCIAVWTGGNEHYHYWEAVDSGSEPMQPIREKVREMFGIAADSRTWMGGNAHDHPALQLLQSVLAEEAPFAHYNITSGLEEQGETHGPWTFRMEIGDHRFRDFDFYQFWRGTDEAFHSESSVSGPAHPETFAEILGLDSLQGVSLPATRDDPLWVAHKAFKAAWDGIDDNWLDLSGAEQMFGKLPDLETLVRALSFVQCEATRFMIESVRRRQGAATGIVWWGINEPFPALAGNALIDFHGRTKPALDAMRTAFEPHLLSFDYPHLLDSKLRGEIWFTNSRNGPFHGRFRATLRREDGPAVETFEGVIRMDAFATGPLRQIAPLPMDGAAWCTLDLELFDAAGATIGSKRYRTFDASRQYPVRPILDAG